MVDAKREGVPGGTLEEALSGAPRLRLQFERAHAKGRAAWPGLEVPFSAFAAYLWARVPHGSPAEAEAYLETCHAGDLYAVLAALRGDPQAVAALEQRFDAAARGPLGRARRLGLEVDELRQLLRSRLYVAPPGGKAELENYRGTGPVAAWLRVVVARTAIDLLEEERRLRPEAVSTERAWATVAIDEDVELGATKRQLSAPFQAALREAAQALLPEQRAILRQYYGHGVGIDGVAKLLGVHRSNASRALARARAAMLSHVRRSMTRQLGAVGADVDSLLRLMRGDVTLSLEALFRSDASGAPSDEG